MSPGKSALRWLLISASICACFGGSSTAFLNGPELQTGDLRQIDSFVQQALPIYPKGFQLYNTGSAGNRPVIIKMIDPLRDSRPLPDAGYYTNLPAIIPAGLEGIATSSFVLGGPLVSSPFVQAPGAEPTSADNNAAPSGVLGRSAYLGQPQENLKNSVVEATAQFESSLPADLRNPFYSNRYTAASLAQSSLPDSGEQVVREWDTRKIREGKVRDLLSGAGLI